MKFAIFFGNRGFFPGELIASALADFRRVLSAAGHEALVMEGAGTRYDAVETPAEGRRYAEFLAAHRGEYDGVILSLPNFGDENGALAALGGVDVPVLVQAYPDEIGSMDFAHRRDAVCGKLAMCDVLRQAGIKFSLTRSFAVRPDSPEFAEDLAHFAAVCRVVKGMRRFSIGCIGSRTTAFKTVRVDEIALQRHGVNVETIDLALVFARMREADAGAVAARVAAHRAYADFTGVAPEKEEAIARLAVALDGIVSQYGLQSVAVRCWDEFQKEWGIAACLPMSVLNDAGIPAACETDVSNAVIMRAIALAAGSSIGLFDVNNNWGDAKDCAIMFHCSAIPGSMLSCRGCIGEHLMFRKAYGPGSGVGVFLGEVKAMPLTLGGLKTEDGRLCAFLTEGESTGEKIEKAFFGTGFVFRKDDGDMQGMLNYMARNGYRHHVAFAEGKWAAPVAEALSAYLGYDIARI